MWRILFLACILVGCTYDTSDVGEDDMSVFQQRAKFGNLTPGAGGKVNFQLAHFLDPNTGKPDPGAYTLQFGISDPNTPGGPFRVEAKAEINWAVGGNSVRRVVDCVNGMTITGVAEGVSVNIYDVSFVGGGSPLPYQVTVQVTKGVRPNVGKPPIYSLPIDILPPNSSASKDLPDNIGATSVMVTVAPVTVGAAIGAYDVIVAQQYGGGTLNAYDPRQTDFNPLVPATKSIAIVSSAAAANMYYKIILGIDG